MSTFEIIAGIIFLVAVFGYLNHRLIGLPNAIGITAFGIVASLSVVIAGKFDPALTAAVRTAVDAIDFSDALLHGALGLLLFAGSMHIQFEEIAPEKWMILLLATFGVVLSTFLVGLSFHAVTVWMGSPVPLLSCLLFGALISPTDPVAVLAILKRAGVPKSLETRISGESLFNDGTAVVVFLTLLGLASGDTPEFNPAHTALLFLTEVLGGAAFGLAVGYLGFLMLRDVDNYPLEILITLAMATGGYAMAEALHVSAPIAVVLMGLIVGNQGKRKAMSHETRERLFGFWEVLDELLNLLLFGLIGMEMVTLNLSLGPLDTAIAAVAIVLSARLISIAGPILATPRLRAVAKVTLPLMTWGGLRGGISVALALALPPLPGREIIVYATYAVVIFSILVQALSLGALARRLLHQSA